jgi:hypothetical protein
MDRIPYTLSGHTNDRHTRQLLHGACFPRSSSTPKDGTKDRWLWPYHCQGTTSSSYPRANTGKTFTTSASWLLLGLTALGSISPFAVSLC